MKQRVMLAAPILSVSGYGVHSRLILKALLEYEEYYDIFVNPLPWGRTPWLSANTEEKRTIDELVEKTVIEQQRNNGNLSVDMTIQCTIPSEFQKVSPLDIGVSALCETSKVPIGWIQKINQMDKLIVPSIFNINVLESSKYTVTNQVTGEVVKDFGVTNKEIFNIGYPYKNVEPDDEIMNMKFRSDFNFLCVAQAGPRKNIHKTVKGFIESFFDRDVGLVLKLNMANNSQIDREHTRAMIEELTKEFKDKDCNIELIHGYMTEAEMFGLYNHPQIKGLISLSHGESWCLPLFEAACCGLPVVTCDWGGQSDYLYMKNKKGKNTPMFTKVKHDLKPIQKEAVWPGVLEKDSMWAFPDDGNYSMKLRSFVRDYDQVKKRAERLKSHLEVEYAEEKILKEYHNVFSKDMEEIFDWMNDLEELEEN